MEIVIWGFGRITRNVIFMLGTKGICAIIDSKAEQFETREYLNIPIITFGEYLEKYRDKYILITPMNYQNIITQLRDNGIYWFFLWNEENITNNIFLEKEQICKKIVDLSKNKKIYISGMSFWGILLYQVLCEMETQVSFFDELRHKDFQEKLIRDKHIRVEKKIDIKDAIIINLNKEILELKGDNNIEISVDDLGTWVDRGWKNRLEKYHNVAKENEKIFIVATGPSLQIKDLEKLKEKGIKTIGMNWLFKIFDKTEWRPDYYVISDQAMIFEIMKELENNKNFWGIDTFISDAWMQFWQEEHSQNFYEYHIKYDRYNMKFSDDFANDVYSGMTVVYVCMQLAVYMGYQEIYLLGCDFDYNNVEKQHCYQEKKVINDFDYESVSEAYRVAESYCTSHGIKIYNATRGGKLEIFNRVDFDRI